MKTQNRVQLIGYLGTDPVIRTTPSGAQYAKMRMATDEYFRDVSGQPQHKATWHDVVAWDTVATTVAGNYIKGSHVMVEGRICHRTYADKNGHTRYVTEIKATCLLNLDR